MEVFPSACVGDLSGQEARVFMDLKGHRTRQKQFFFFPCCKHWRSANIHAALPCGSQNATIVQSTGE